MWAGVILADFRRQIEIGAEPRVAAGLGSTDRTGGSGGARPRQVAVRVEERQPIAGQEVLPDQVEEQGAFTGAGLADQIQMPAPLVGIEHYGFARDAGTDAERLCWQFHGRKGAGVPCASLLER